MNTPNLTIEEQVNAFCARIGADPLLVQGAGGNVSWKDGNVLRVKASGARLADAEKKNIFVDVDLPSLQQAVLEKNFSIVPKVLNEMALRPSIETLLHALMPHEVVVHLHHVQLLSILVRDECEAELRLLLKKSFSWVLVDYYKPGASLALAVSLATKTKTDINVIFLRNHGVVIGAESISKVEQIIDGLTSLCASVVGGLFSDYSESLIQKPVNRYVYYPDEDIHQLARNEEYFNALKMKWALYPDHIVFLGPSPFTYESFSEFKRVNFEVNELPELIFIFGEGVYVLPEFGDAKAAQLRCFFEVLRRQKSTSSIRSLSNAQIAELTDWEAEKYRKMLAS
ncbi:class II aldolase/adducin family protein [Undibacterium sp.]|uniref:class II aldolase/adducin family protein n=1 Tax=Undibacterium sp. TaxID=1914977 RepID=UPI0025E0B464|nr:class II aldolase/adducin family protein [Undibacterium sp.]